MVAMAAFFFFLTVRRGFICDSHFLIMFVLSLSLPPIYLPPLLLYTKHSLICSRIMSCGGRANAKVSQEKSGAMAALTKAGMFARSMQRFSMTFLVKKTKKNTCTCFLNFPDGMPIEDQSDDDDGYWM